MHMQFLKLKQLAVLIGILLMASSPVFGGSASSLTILYTGDVRGKIKPFKL